MTHDPTVVSFFAGIGGFDLGLERAGFRTVAFSEIDPFAIAVYRTHWPDAVALGSIVDVPQSDDRHHRDGAPALDVGPRGSAIQRVLRADLWTGGFPCQDLSVAGKRAGLAGERSGLALTFLDLVRQHRPRAILLENVPGLLSSNRGRDLAVLVGRLADMGYMGAFRVLDARWFGVAQRRRRVFILAFDDDAFGGTGEQRAFEVLFEPESGSGDPAAGGEAGAGVATAVDGGATGTVGPIRSHLRPGTNSLTGIVGTLNAGMDSGVHNGQDDHAGFLVVNAITPVRGGPDDNDAQSGHLVTAAALTASNGHHGHSSPRGDGSDNLVITGTLLAPGPEGGRRDRIPVALSGPSPDSGGVRAAPRLPGRLDDPLPLGMDSARYRVLGNAVCVNVAEWIGHRLRPHLGGGLT